MEESPNIFILPNGLSKAYIQDLKEASLKNNFKIQDKFDLNSTNIVVSNLSDFEQIKKILLKNSNIQDYKILFVNLKWIIESNKSVKLSNCLDSSYFIGSLNPELSPSKDNLLNLKQNLTDEIDIPDYECQRSTPLRHLNEEFTNALEILEEHAKFKGTEVDLLRALAFRKCICVLKCLPFKLTTLKQIKNLKHIGDHSKSVIEDIISYGYSKEVDDIVSQEYYQTVKKFNSIYGCGSIVSNRLFDLGYIDIQNLRENCEELNKKIHGDFERFKYGLTYYDDLTNNKISKDEAFCIFETIKNLILEDVDSNCQIELMGGFRRGKNQGHDVDFLITHPTLGQEKSILKKTIQVLEEKGYIIYGKHDRASTSDWTKASSKNVIDHFERYISILKFPIYSKDLENKLGPETKKLKTETIVDAQEYLEKILSSLDASKYKRDWIARRVDLIVCPIDQFPFAILGWTGSKQFNRSIRLYSDREFGYRLSSHGLYNYKNNNFIKAKTEREIFDILKLTYREPWERNC